LKRAYRRKALELHPDRNYGREAEATAEFADIQSAYDVLSDQHERAWYDAHEGDILRGVDPSAEKDPRADAGEKHAYGVRLTTASDLTAFLGAFQARRGMSAGSLDGGAMPAEFYKELGALFGRLADEEVAAAQAESSDEPPPDYPAFGDGDSAYETHVRGFYAAWTGFATRKTFFWADRYRVADAEDRRMRRAIEKENKKLRDEGVREFNEAVRALAAFVRRRDPRWTPNRASAEERQKMLRGVARAQAEGSRRENAKREAGEVPEWAKGGGAEDVEEWGGWSDEEEEEVVFECVVCDKTFKSENQVAAHERSKKHLTALKKLQWEMRLDNDALALDADGGEPTNNEPGAEALADAVGDVSLADEQASSSGDEDDDDGSSVAANPAPSTALGTPVDGSSRADAPSSPGPKVGKAAQKRARKAAAASQKGGDEGSYKCAQCNAAFPSRTRLFQHIGDFGHAALKPAAAGAKARKKGKR
jgi:DnaJ family protein A protein 5